ncbi:MAG: 16S rRNA (guanine(527)-N(7))-methyltransferase RsmG [Chloroflexi bacterium]|nr:16S rRNA (guanine(527)-N(7))-methyltransferase RsmG [Chloroflexota bacterium]
MRTNAIVPPSMETLVKGARGLRIELYPRQVQAFALYRDTILEGNRRANLTGLASAGEVERLLLLDSLTVALALPHPVSAGTRLLDVGSGAGIPGIPLKLAFPELSVTLLEATGKKARFMREAVATLRLHDVTVVAGRAEEIAHQPEHRESYPLVTARALAPLATLAELCLPFASVGGRVIAPKGRGVDEEIAQAQRAIALLGGSVREVVPVSLPELPPGRCLVVLEKVASTPALYPRRPGVPKKRPLFARAPGEGGGPSPAID